MAYFVVVQHDGEIDFRLEAQVGETVCPGVVAAWATLHQLAKVRELTDHIANLNRSLNVIARDNRSDHGIKR